MKKLIVFTDLDGTLLHHDTYDWTPALPAINLLKQHGFPLVLNSSKTSSEIKQLRKKLANDAPYICENGAVVHFNEQMKGDVEDSMAVIYFAKPYAYIKQVLDDIKKNYHFDMFGFDDIDVKTLMDLTELDETSARAAKQREATEPLVWNDNAESLDNFVRLLNKQGLTLTKGGRFHHVISPVSKGESIKWLIEKYQEMEPETQWVTAGLGDSFNDISMLEQVDYPVLIKNPHGKKPNVAHIANLVESKLQGPAGWNVEVTDIIKTITGTG
ncbi:MAG: HAD-IIB family hydrolase [Gammaproteobacteria bacterium]